MKKIKSGVSAIINIPDESAQYKATIVKSKTKTIDFERWGVFNCGNSEYMIELLSPHYVDFAVINTVLGFLSKKTWLCSCTIAKVADVAKINRNVVSESFERLQMKKVMLWYKDKDGEGFVFDSDVYKFGDGDKYAKMYNAALELNKELLEKLPERLQQREAKRETYRLIAKIKKRIEKGEDSEHAMAHVLKGVSDVIRQEVEFSMTPALEEY